VECTGSIGGVETLSGIACGAAASGAAGESAAGAAAVDVADRSAALCRVATYPPPAAAATQATPSAAMANRFGTMEACLLEPIKPNARRMPGLCCTRLP